MHRDERGGLRCSFCHATTRPGQVAVDDTDAVATICAECLAGCNTLLRSEPPDPVLLRPDAIVARLDRDVVGQERAKRQLAVAVYTHGKRQLIGDSEIELGKSNVLLIGPTGTGKTHLVRSLAKILDVPLHIGDATALTEAGYVGEDVSSLLAGLLAAARGDVARAQRGILYIDEIDKLASRSASQNAGRDVGGEGVQQALLRLIEGAQVEVKLEGQPGRARTVMFDTSGLLIIGGGAFCGLEDVVARRVSRRAVGFGGGRANEDPAEPLAGLRPEDLHTFGLIPEFTGRMPVLAALLPLDEDALVAILTRPRAALVKQYQKLFAMDGLSLEFTPGALRAVARSCLASGTGARGLRATLERLLLEPMFDLPGREDVCGVWITEDVVDGLSAAPLVLRSETG